MCEKAVLHTKGNLPLIVRKCWGITNDIIVSILAMNYSCVQKRFCTQKAILPLIVRKCWEIEVIPLRTIFLCVVWRGLCRKRKVVICEVYLFFLLHVLKGWVYFYYYRLAGQDPFCCNWSRSYVDTPYARCCRADPVAVHVPILFFSRSLWRFCFIFFES